MFPAVVETDRLRLEAVGTGTLDALTIYAHCNPDAPAIDEVTRYLTWEPHETPKASREFLRDAREAYEADEAAHYAIYPRDGEEGAGEFAGMTHLGPDWNRRLATLGTWLREPFWGRGYSGERAHALMYVAFERLDLDLVAVTCNVDNEQSRRAIRKYVSAHGGREEGELRNFMRYQDGGVVDVHRFSVSQAEFRESENHPTEVDLRNEEHSTDVDLPDDT